MRRLCVITVAAALAVTAPAAGAAEPWSPAAAVPGARDAWPRVVVGSDGRGAVIWRDKAAPCVFVPAVFEAAFGPDGTVGAATAVRTDMDLAGVEDPAVVAGRRLAVIGMQRRGSRWRGVVVTGRVGKRLGAPVALPGSWSAAAPASGPPPPCNPRLPMPNGLAVTRGVTVPLGVAGTPNGDVAVVARRCAGGSDCRPSAALLWVRRAGRPPVTYRLAANGRTYAAGVAMSARGDVLVAWERNDALYARVLTRHGWRSGAQRLGHTQAFAHVRALFASDGHAVVAWSDQAVSEGDPGSDFTAQVARETTPGRFGRALRLGSAPMAGTGNYVGYAGVAATPLPGGRVALAWTDYLDQFTVRAADLNPDGTLTAPQMLAPADGNAVLTGLAGAPSGRVVALWLAGRAGADPASGEPRYGLYASTRPPAATAYGAPEQLIDGTPDGGSVAIDPIGDHAIATWRTVSGPIAFSTRPPG
ncbi:MAG: hypothetical protein JWO74_1127 [Solirubrobacterales bacterium]|nr:hypothetical protein [Solirubrobacterales bacterium]